MKTDLVRPCSHCPFRKDIPAYLTAERVEEICHSLIEEDKSFSCHETNQFNDDGDTIETAESQHCAGAMILLEKLERPNQWMRIMERLRLYDHKKLDMAAPVFDSAEEMVNAQPERRSPRTRASTKNRSRSRKVRKGKLRKSK